MEPKHYGSPWIWFLLEEMWTVQGKGKGKGISIPVHAWAGYEGSRVLRLSDFKLSAHESSNVVKPTHREPLSPINIAGSHFH